MTSGVSCEQLAEPQQQQQQNRAAAAAVPVQQEDIRERELADPIGGRQFRSESGDSGQLSLISSFGSISINQITSDQQHPRLKRRLASESSQEFSGSNYVDYQQYCSLMLLNSFDCFEADQIIDNRHQLLYESLKSLPNDKQESLAERRARWFTGVEQRLQGGGGSGHCCCGEGEQRPEQQEAKSVHQEANGKQFGGQECDKGNKGRNRRSGKKLVAALAATQSSLMDKFWTHMVKRTAAPSNSNGNGKRQNSPFESAQKDRQQVVAVKAVAAPPQSGGGIHLLSDLSRRLVRRYGGTKQAKVTRAQWTSESALEGSNSSVVMRTVGGDHRVASAAMTSEHKRSALVTSPTSSSCQQLSGAVGLNNLNASVSTLNTATTPSGCCYCDNETCSSSGFVSSAATTAPAPISSIASRATGGTSSPSSTTAATSNCCNDSIANHSCSSSSYNDHHLNGVATAAASPTPEQELQQHMSLGIEEPKLNNASIAHQGSSAAQVALGVAAVSATMAAASPVSLAAHHEQAEAGGPTTTIIEVPAKQEERPRDHQQAAEAKGQTKDLLKPKGSLLSRARNSNINLASLAPIATRFNCSASVGNLWSHHHHHGHRSHSPNSPANVASELLTPEHDGIQTLDYVACKTFDETRAEHPEHREADCIKSQSSNKLLAAQSCGLSSRKLSTKEKCRRQKDAERVEKLRLLVSYLRSGSSQPVVSPVTLEADEIELAERYKLHMALRDDLLNLTDGEVQSAPPAGGHSQKSPELSPIVSSGAARGSHLSTCTAESVNVTSTTSPTTSSCSMSQHHRGSVSVVDYQAACGGANANNSSSSNHANGRHVDKLANPTVSATRSIPQIGQISWALRHSISDPGNKFGHMFACNAGAYCSSASGVRSSTASAFSANQHHESVGQFGQRMAALSVGQVVQQLPTSSLPHQRTNSCKTTSDSCRNCRNNHHTNNSSSSSSSIQPQQQHRQPARLFYIDDIDAPHAHLPPIGPKISESQHYLMSTPNATANDSMATMMTQATSSGNFTSSICSGDSQPSPASATAGATLNSSKSCSAWTNPQNLATWIDNEVNSLVHDLEVNESQQRLSGGRHKHQQSGQKHNSRQSDKSASSNSSCKNKEGKRKWLSVTSANIRRSSSGAQST